MQFLTSDDIKAKLPVTYALHVYGHEPAGRKGRDILYRTPWRQDDSPSLACYPSEDHGIVNRWRDNARQEGGDVFDMIASLAADNSLSFPETVKMARSMLDEMESSGWVAPEPISAGGSFDLEEARAQLNRDALVSDRDALLSWLEQREDATTRISPSWLRERFGVFVKNGIIYAPYGDEGLYKYRDFDGKFISPSGTRGMWDCLYGEHLDLDKTRPVVLCEGEPDVWSGTHSTEDYVFLGLPTGAGTRPEKLQSRLVGRHVLLAFDGDAAGRGAAIAWASALLANGGQVSIVPLPEGSDLSDMPDIPLVLSKARSFISRMPGLISLGDKYHRASRDGSPGQQISDFVLTPQRVMISTTGALSYVVEIASRPQVLTARDLSSKRAFRSWASSFGRTWAGSDTDTTVLANNLAVDSLFVSVEAAAPTEGWHEGQFVWSGGYIGPRPMRHVPDGVRARLDISLPQERPMRPELSALLDLGDSEVVHPLMAWAAAAPWRSRFDQFPILNVAGASGSGKTTLIEQIIPRITGSSTIHTLTSTTPFAVEAYISSTNAFPVVFDEYRPGARSESLARLEQLLRDAYDGTPGTKSAGGDKWHETQEIQTLAPLVVAGEQSISETSHAERMILVHLTRPQERNAGHVSALRRLRTLPSCLSHSYLGWITYKAGPAPVISEPDRVAYNMEMLRFGWGALKDWTWDLGWHDMLPDEPDLSAVQATTSELTSTNPIRAALAWALGDRNAAENVWREDEYLYVQVASFVRDVRNNGTFVLPGNNGKTISDYLQRQHGGYETKREHPDDYTKKRKQVMRVPFERVFGVD